MSSDQHVKARIEAMLGIGCKSVQAPTFRAIAETASFEEVKARGIRPDGVSAEILECSPALGPVRLFRDETVEKTSEGNFRYRRADAVGLRRGDAFDVMQDQANRRARAKGKEPSLLFTQAQIEAGRTYGHLVERHAARGARGMSIETVGRSGGGGSYMDAVVMEGRRLDRMRAKIASLWALEPKRVSPAGDRRRAIRMITVIDHVCVDEITLSQVLTRYGWTAGARNLTPFREAFREGLNNLYAM